MKYFLLVYDRKLGTVLRLSEYSAEDRALAIRERFALEREEREHPDTEIVVLGAGSREDLKRTHSRYFQTSSEIASHLLATVG